MMGENPEARGTKDSMDWDDDQAMLADSDGELASDVDGSRLWDSDGDSGTDDGVRCRLGRGPDLCFGDTSQESPTSASPR